MARKLEFVADDHTRDRIRLDGSTMYSIDVNLCFCGVDESEQEVSYWGTVCGNSELKLSWWSVEKKIS